MLPSWRYLDFYGCYLSSGLRSIYSNHVCVFGTALGAPAIFGNKYSIVLFCLQTFYFFFFLTDLWLVSKEHGNHTTSAHGKCTVTVYDNYSTVFTSIQRAEHDPRRQLPLHLTPFALLLLNFLTVSICRIISITNTSCFTPRQDNMF